MCVTHRGLVLIGTDATDRQITVASRNDVRLPTLHPVKTRIASSSPHLRACISSFFFLSSYSHLEKGRLYRDDDDSLFEMTSVSH